MPLNSLLFLKRNTRPPSPLNRFPEPVQSLAVRGKSADRDELQGASRRRALWPGEDLQRRRPPETALFAPAGRL